MDFQFNEEQQLLQESIRRFLGEQYGFEQRKKILRSAPGYSRSVWNDLAELGLLGLNVPASEGGLGGGAIETLLVAGAMGEALVVEPFLSSAVIATRTIASIGTAAHRQSLLPDMMAGNLICVPAWDPAPASERVTRVRAKPTRTGWILEGRVPVVYHASVAELLLVPAVVTSQTGNCDAIFVLKSQGPGITQRACVTVDGQPAADVQLDDVPVDASMRLDEAASSAGSAELEARLAAIDDFAVMALCAEALGALDTALALTVEYTRTRQQFGAPIARFQALQHRMVDMLVRIEQARSLVYLAASRCDSADPNARSEAVSAAKVLIADAARFVGQHAVQLHGGMGMADESSISHYFKRLLAAEIRCGSADAHLNRFAALRSAG